MKKLFSFLLIVVLIACSKDPVMYTLTATANPAEGGSVSPSSQQYDSGDVATVTANPSAEYVFQSWSGSASGSSTSTNVTMDSDKAVVANFVKKKYALTINVEGEGTVSEKVIKAGVATDYNSGTVVELTAVPEGEWLFVEWTGDLTGSENPKEITIDKAKTVTAVFVKKQYPLTIEIEGEGTVSEKVIKQGLATDYNSGTIVELTAEPTGDWEFVEWTGDITSTENPVQITIDGPKTVKVKFMRHFNYKVPSHDWENFYAPWFDLAKITDSLGFTKKDSYNTNSAYADFNFDGYIDIMIQPNVNDGVPVETFFLINNKENKFSVDTNFPIEFQTSAISSRKTIVGDFNGDGKPDVVRPQGGHDWLGKPTITLSSEDESFSFKLIGDGPQVQPHTICSGDIDNDGDLDLFFAQAGEQDGFLINDGSANFTWKWISEIIQDFDGGHKYPNGKFGAYGFWSSEITDVDKDGYVDLILGGSYKDEDYDSGFYGPTILWGDGSGQFYKSNSTTLFNDRDELNYLNGDRISLSHDYSVGDINKDGYNDIVLYSDLRNDQNGVFYQVILATGKRTFEDKTNELLPDFHRSGTGGNHVWILLRDVDGDGELNIVEGEPMLSIQNTPTNQTGWRKSVNWNWNGSSFEKIN